jgi:hypothetical protein
MPSYLQQQKQQQQQQQQPEPNAQQTMQIQKLGSSSFSRNNNSRTPLGVAPQETSRSSMAGECDQILRVEENTENERFLIFTRVLMK